MHWSCYSVQTRGYRKGALRGDIHPASTEHISTKEAHSARPIGELIPRMCERGGDRRRLQQVLLTGIRRGAGIASTHGTKTLSPCSRLADDPPWRSKGQIEQWESAHIATPSLGGVWGESAVYARKYCVRCVCIPCITDVQGD